MTAERLTTTELSTVAPERNTLRCPPYVPPAPADVDIAGNPLSILERVSRAHTAANHWRQLMDARADFTATLKAAATMAHAIDAIATAVADAVAEGNGKLT